MANLAYGYARVSHKKQLSKHNNGESESDSLASQDRRERDYYKMFLSDPELKIEYANTMFDRAVSASRIPFDRRPAAIELMRSLRPYDHVIVDKVDRIYRSLKDFVRQNDWFEKHNITVHYMDFAGHTIRTDNPMGKMLLVMWVCLAEMEARNTSERLKAANKELRLRGTVNSPMNVPCCCKIVMAEGQRTMIWDDLELAIANRVVELRDVEKKTFDSIAKLLTPMSQKLNATHQQAKRYYETAKLIEKYSIKRPEDIFAAKRKEESEKNLSRMLAERDKPIDKKPKAPPVDRTKYLRRLGIS